MLSILGFIADIFKPAAALIDDLHTSEEETLKIKQAMFKMEQATTLKLMEYESQLLTAKTDIIKSEANSASWIARNWRPITMLSFLVLVVADSFSWLPNPLAKEAWTMLQIGLSGYVVGKFVHEHARALEFQIDPDDGTPYKKQYDPRAYLRLGEEGIVARLLAACDDLGSKGKSIANG